MMRNDSTPILNRLLTPMFALRHALAALALCGVMQAGNPPEPILGGSFGQTMRIAVAADSASRCAATAGFVDSANSPPDPTKTLDLGPGEVGIADINLNRLAPRFGQRIELRAVVTPITGKCSATAMVFENFTGRVTASLKLSDPPDPIRPGEGSPPDPVFPSIGVALGQIVRLGVARTGNPPEPVSPPTCAALLAFFDGRGNPVGPVKAVNLTPGQIDFLDLNPSLLPAGTGPRIAQPRLLLPASGGDLSGCGASVQVFDTLTGWSTEAVNGR